MTITMKKLLLAAVIAAASMFQPLPSVASQSACASAAYDLDLVDSYETEARAYSKEGDYDTAQTMRASESHQMDIAEQDIVGCDDPDVNLRFYGNRIIDQEVDVEEYNKSADRLYDDAVSVTALWNTLHRLHSMGLAGQESLYGVGKQDAKVAFNLLGWDWRSPDSVDDAPASWGPMPPKPEE